ncbi:hypothetical protein SVIOM342S_02780 [Streptomyces violaceorubidus]
MAGRAVRTEQVSATRQLILTTAERLFAEHGVYAVSNRQVSEAAGQGNNAAVGYHFGTKADLVRAIAQRHSERVEELRARQLAALGDSSDLRDWVDCLVRPQFDHLAALGSPTWYARFCADGTPDGYLATAEAPGGPVPSLTDDAVRQASLSLSVLDPGLRFVHVNDSACRMMGRSEEELVGRSLPDALAEFEGGRAQLPAPPAGGHRPGAARPVRELRARARRQPPARLDRGDLAGPRRLRHAHRRRDGGAGEHRTAPGPGAAGPAERGRRGRQHPRRRPYRRGTGRAPRAPVRRFAGVDLLDWVLGTDEPLAAPPGTGELRRVAHASATEGFPTPAVHLGGSEVHPPDSPPARAVREGRVVLSGPGDPEFDRWMRTREAEAPHNRPFREAVCSTLSVPLRARGTTLGVALAVRTAPRRAGTPRRTPYWPRNWSPGPPSPWTTPAVSRASAPPLWRSSTACCPGTCPDRPRSRWPTAICPPRIRRGHRAADWFDVIPLSGTRVGLVVGDVVGHGIPSTATMGRLCTAVRTLADVDLPPDELLTHLDDLVTHLAAGGADDGAEAETAELGATCLYGRVRPRLPPTGPGRRRSPRARPRSSPTAPPVSST